MLILELIDCDKHTHYRPYDWRCTNHSNPSYLGMTIVPSPDLTGTCEAIMEHSRLGDPRADVAGDFDFLPWVDIPRNSPSDVEAWEASAATPITQSSEAYSDAFNERRHEIPRVQKQKGSHGKGIRNNLKPRKVACLRCQKAKVRCDISQGAPCSRCKRTKSECIRHPHCSRYGQALSDSLGEKLW